MDPLAELPDDVAELIAPHLEPGHGQLAPGALNAIGVALAKRRDEAKTARASSGIEKTWKDCEEQYYGIDDANRGEFAEAKWVKPMSMDGPVSTARQPKATEHKSTVFVRLTARYVDAGAAKLSEILLPADDKAFSFSETPVPELIKAKKDTSQIVHDGMGNVPLTRPLKPGETPPGTDNSSSATVLPFPAPAAAPGSSPGGAGRVPLTVKDLAEENIDIAHQAAVAAETRIYDWMVECHYQAEMRKVIFDCARLGAGILKAPFPMVKKSIAVKKSAEGVTEIEIEEKIRPAAKWVDPWNIFPDATCGEDIHNGDFIFERDYLSDRQVRDLKDLPGYIAGEIDKVLEEGPQKQTDANRRPGDPLNQNKDRYEVWYYYGTLKPEEMNAIASAAGTAPGDAKKKVSVYAIVTLINEHAIRATINPLDSGSFPYHAVPWQRRAGHWAGVGVAEQSIVPQRMINAATRAMLNNAGKSAGTQIVVDRGAITPADNNWTVTPDKIWYKNADSQGTDVRQAFMAIEIPNRTAELMKIVEYALKLAEESTSIPLITQGQSGETTPDTYGAAQLQNTNANQLLRSIGYAFDNYITEPVVRQFYEWLLLDPDVPEEEKGDFSINAHGSVALVERAIADQTIAQMGTLVINPAYGFDPKRWAEQMLKAKHIDPATFKYTKAEQERIDSQPQPGPPQIEVAKIAQDTQLKLGVMKQSADQQNQVSEERIATAAHTLEGARIETTQQKAATEATVRLHEMEERRQLAMLEYANRHQITIDQARALLAKTAMTLETQKELNAADITADLHKHHSTLAHEAAKPPAQVPGRAGNNRAFEQGP
jgi:hypothetical protein